MTTSNFWISWSTSINSSVRTYVSCKCCTRASETPTALQIAITRWGESSPVLGQVPNVKLSHRLPRKKMGSDSTKNKRRCEGSVELETASSRSIELQIKLRLMTR